MPARGRRRRSPAPRGAMRPTPGASTSTSTVRPISSSRRRAVMASCSSVSSARRSAIEPGRHLAVEVGGVRAVLAAVGEEPAPVEVGLLDEAQQLVVVALGLARVADDEVAAERGVGLAVADVGDAAQEAVAVAPAPHPPQQRLADVLQRQVEVRHPAVADGVDEAVGQVARVQVQQAHPVGALGDGAHERDDDAGAELVGHVLAVRREVLGDEHDLARRQLVDLARGSTRRCGCAAGRGTTGWRRTRTSGRSPRRS